MTDNNYVDKKKLLFDSLISAEECVKGTGLEQKPIEEYKDSYRTNDKKSVVRRFNGRESIFKRPAAPISQCLKPKKSPDFKVNPHKWKKYSLEDADISDRSNTSAAFQFLADIERKKQNANDDDDDDDGDGNDKVMKSSNKIVFNRKKPKFNQSVSLRKDAEIVAADSQCDKAVLKGSKLVMPEYVIGQKLKAKDKKPAQTITSRKSSRQKDSATASLQLDHLMEEDDDDN